MSDPRRIGDKGFYRPNHPTPPDGEPTQFTGYNPVDGVARLAICSLCAKWWDQSVDAVEGTALCGRHNEWERAYRDKLRELALTRPLTKDDHFRARDEARVRLGMATPLARDRHNPALQAKINYRWRSSDPHAEPGLVHDPRHGQTDPRSGPDE